MFGSELTDKHVVAFGAAIKSHFVLSIVFSVRTTTLKERVQVNESNSIFLPLDSTRVALHDSQLPWCSSGSVLLSETSHFSSSSSKATLPLSQVSSDWLSGGTCVVTELHA